MIINLVNAAAIVTSISMGIKNFNKMKYESSTKGKIIYIINIVLSIGIAISNFKLLADRNFLPEEDDEE